MSFKQGQKVKVVSRSGTYSRYFGHVATIMDGGEVVARAYLNAGHPLSFYHWELRELSPLEKLAAEAE